MRIYIDIDDTLAGFRQHAIANGVPAWSGSWYTTDKALWTDEQRRTQDMTNDLMRNEDFWMSIPVLPRAHELIAAASFHGPVTLLTALPSSFVGDNALLAMVRRAKIRYAWQQLHVPPERVEVCVRAEKVRYAFDHFSKMACVLIDDAKATCDEWENAGGVAFHVEHAENGLHEAIDFIKCL